MFRCRDKGIPVTGVHEAYCLDALDGKWKGLYHLIANDEWVVAPPELPDWKWQDPPDNMPAAGTIWRHWKGGLYTVIGYTWRWDERETEKTGKFSPILDKPLVVYLSAKTGEAWVRDLDDWHKSVEVGGMKMPRFQHFSGGE